MDVQDWNRSIIAEFRAGGGATRFFGRDLVILHHIGAHSGAPRVTPLVARHPDAQTWLLSASDSGAPRNPAWYHNLLAHPDVHIETPDDGDVPVHATELHGSARDEAWRLFVDFSDRYAGYQEKTRRRIPVIAVRRRSGGVDG